jgi:hypothetical protein
MKHHRIFYNVFTKVERKIYLPFWSFSRKSKKKKEENNFQKKYTFFGIIPKINFI